MLNERLLTIEWEQRELPDASAGRRGILAAAQHVRRGDGAGDVGGRCADRRGRGVHDVSWPMAGDQLVAPTAARPHRCVPTWAAAISPRPRTGTEAIKGVVVVTAPPEATEDDRLRAAVASTWHPGGLARELAELPGEPPRLYAVTRSAASVWTAIWPTWSKPDCVA